ncbi:NUDIX hydrolase [Georgenia sp. Z1491]|uniref:NUDIX hydrolase n=1 Tax=Georgenia sp. Z1491 TaxID=3416707 RepID=UPI003CF2D9B8
MGTPDFVLELRRHVGHALLWMTATSAVVVRDRAHRPPPMPSPDDAAATPGTPGPRREVLLVRRADNGRWTPVTGIVDPGEQVADAAVREVLEETGVRARAVRLVRLHTLEPITYANGDVAQYVDATFRCEWVAGEPYPADGENTEARWFDLDELPEMGEEMRVRIDAALTPERPARFTGGDAPAPHRGSPGEDAPGPH